jgi:hypothetical protein
MWNAKGVNVSNVQRQNAVRTTRTAVISPVQTGVEFVKHPVVAVATEIPVYAAKNVIEWTASAVTTVIVLNVSAAVRTERVQRFTRTTIRYVVK